MRIFIFLIAMIVGTTALAAGNFPDNNSGDWQGVGIQVDGQEWSVGVNIGPKSSNVTYESIGCGGKWAYVMVNDDRITAIEALAFGREVCLDGGLLTVERFDENALIFSYFDQAGVIIAKAILIEGKYKEDRYDALRKLTLDSVGKGFIIGPNAKITFGDNKT